jgi:hypothetical protein
MMIENDLESQIANWQAGRVAAAEDLAKFIERADTACLAYNGGTVEEKRESAGRVGIEPYHRWKNPSDCAQFALPGKLRPRSRLMHTLCFDTPKLPLRATAHCASAILPEA